MRIAVAVRMVCAVAWVSVAFAGCDTDAVGVEDCREIERARCDASRFCDLRIVTDADVEACKRFARDHCLHGLEVDEPPSSTELADCVDVITAAGACAEQNDAEVLAGACAEGLAGVPADQRACDVIATPEVAPDCQFLVAEEPEEEPDAAPPPPTPPPDAASGDGG